MELWDSCQLSGTKKNVGKNIIQVVGRRIYIIFIMNIYKYLKGLILNIRIVLG